MRRAAGLLGAVLLALSACTQPAPEPVRPALWEVTGPHGEHGWLFGTIHALPQRVEWRSHQLGAALDAADRLVVEVADIDDQGRIAAAFTQMSFTPGQPLLRDRVAPPLRGQLASLLGRIGMDDGDFAAIETWAAAITITRKLQRESNSGFGIDRALIAATRGKVLVELEGVETQFASFDRLPEAEQRDLLELVISEAAASSDATRRLASAWKQGDMAAIEAETHDGLLADPELRAALLVARNRAWEAKLGAMLKGGAHPFVAVGAAHMAGPDGLPALLARQGYTVARIQ